MHFSFYYVFFQESLSYLKVHNRRHLACLSYLYHHSVLKTGHEMVADGSAGSGSGVIYFSIARLGSDTFVACLL